MFLDFAFLLYYFIFLGLLAYFCQRSNQPHQTQDNNGLFTENKAHALKNIRIVHFQSWAVLLLDVNFNKHFKGTSVSRKTDNHPLSYMNLKAVSLFFFFFLMRIAIALWLGDLHFY